MNYRQTSSILALGVLGGFIATTGGVFFLAPDHMGEVITAWVALSTMTIREYFGVPGPPEPVESVEER